MHIINSWDELDFQEHPFLCNSEKVNEVIKPIVKHFRLDSFNYHKTYHDRSQIRLTNQPNWYEHYLKEKLYLHSIFELNSKIYSPCYILLSNIITHGNILNDAKKFGINHAITFIDPCDDGCQFFFLGTTQNDPDFLNQYISNIQLVKKFIHYFNIKAISLINEIEKYKTKSLDMKQNQLKFNQINELDKFTFISELYNLKFTSRELECITFLLKGNTSKQIANELNISFRTIEVYIEQLKFKLNVKSKNDLIRVLLEIYR
ncbi:MAG: DNA-binding CsgD family transcriptional regulator [Francisellaceae bacterium]|jgi:DNA-binding CsgD family transcriptional regulator